MKLAGSKVLLTGATGGLGATLARALHGRGARLVLSGRRLEVLQGLADELGAQAIAADLSGRDQVERLAAATADVDVLIANAAVVGSGHLLELSQPQIDAMLEIDLRAPIALARALAPAMASRGRGQIVLISSLSGKAASPAASIYSASKFGLRGFAHGARADLRGSGVGVSVIMPGFIRDAGMFADANVKLPPGAGTSSPEQVASAVISAIERNRGEVTVAPLALRAGASAAAAFPGIAAFGQRLFGAARLAGRISAGQAVKRPEDAPLRPPDER
ncbi:MAG: SDR family NAD(P)-dependent oxidoreductase [Acidobacteriota bacterium]|nr:SDR family NAD(P)-dependent oxidoreductase [Acidobacteriota bacterium]